MDKKITLKWPTEKSAMSNSDWILLHFLKRVTTRQAGNTVTFDVPSLIDYNKIRRLAGQCGAEVVSTAPVMDAARAGEIHRKFEELGNDTQAIREWMASELSKEEIFDFFWGWVFTLQR